MRTIEVAANIAVLVPISEEMTLSLEVDKDFESETEIDATILQSSLDELIPERVPLLEISDEHRQVIVNALLDLLEDVRWDGCDD